MKAFTQPVFALANCEKDSKITWDPRIFPENSTEFKLNFTINDNNVLTNLINGYAYLVIDKKLYSEGYPTAPIQITGNKFEITLPMGGATERGIRWATLRWTPVGKNSYTDTCSEIAYQVGSVDKCKVDQNTPSSIPPGSTLIVGFVGKANAYYELDWCKGNCLISTFLDKVTTQSDGQGVFSPITIPGINGDTGKLYVSRTRITTDLITGVPSDNAACYTDIKIDIGASPQTYVPNPVQINAAAGPILRCPNPGEKFDKAIHLECGNAGGKQVPGCGIPDANGAPDPRGPGIATAIGCIHTNPAELTKDLLKFVIGIGGGLAFLMMLLGVFQMLTSAGNPETLKAGQDRLTSAVIGLLFVIFAVLLLQIIGFDILKIPKFGR